MGLIRKRKSNSFANREAVGWVGLVETKVKANRIERLASSLYPGWQYVTNLEHHYNWEDLAELEA